MSLMTTEPRATSNVEMRLQAPLAQLDRTIYV